MPPPCADAYVPGSTASRSSGPGSGIASTSPAYAKLQRLSTDVPATSSLPDEISLPEPGSLSALTVGRHAHKNDVMLDCKLVPSLLSRQHAEIHCDTEGVHYVMDKNTLNGTYLNGNLIPTGPVPLKDGDVIAFGGPTNVLRDNMTHKNSFRFIYRCPKNVEQWRAAVQACSDAEAAANATPTADARDAAPPSKRARVGDGSGLPETAPGARASDAIPPPPANAATPRIALDLAADMGLAPEGYRSAGRPVAKLSRRDWVTTRRVALKMESRSVEFLSQALSEVGTALGESVIPLSVSDENVLQGIITDHGKLFLNTREAVSRSGVASPNAVSDADMTVMTQATQEYACISPTKGLNSDASTAEFIRRACRDALQLHLSPAGVVTFSLKLLDAHAVWNSEFFLEKEQRDKSAKFKRGDLVAEAAALALWPLSQLGWDDAGDTGKEIVGVAAHKKSGPEKTTTGFTLNDCIFAASVSEIDGRGCDVGPEGCAALAESALAPRQKTDGVWMYNQSLLGLCLADNPRIGDQGCAAIATTLQPKPCANGSRTRQFTTMFNTTLTTLDLSGCGIGPKGAGALVGALRPVLNDNGDRCFPSGLRTLNLSGNCLESEGCRSIARLLGPDNNVQTGTWRPTPRSPCLTSLIIPEWTIRWLKLSRTHSFPRHRNALRTKRKRRMKWTRSSWSTPHSWNLTCADTRSLLRASMWCRRLSLQRRTVQKVLWLRKLPSFCHALLRRRLHRRNPNASSTPTVTILSWCFRLSLVAPRSVDLCLASIGERGGLRHTRLARTIRLSKVVPPGKLM